MLNIKRSNPWIGCLLMASAGLVGCAPKTNVSATGTMPAQYSHVFMTIQEIWFHTSATAGPDDTAWIKFPLKTPVTVDLVAPAGSLTSITTGLNVPVGNYAQIRLIPVDSGSTALSSATNAGAVYNSEVDYADGTGAAALELQNPDRGIGIATSIVVKSTSGNLLSSSSTTSSSSNSTTSTGTTGTSSSSNTTFSLAINVDGLKDIVPFKYDTVNAVGTVNGVLLNPHMTAYDASAVGAIAGTLSTAGLTGLTITNGIEVTAESLSADGTRHVAVISAPVHSDGTFTLYPLATTAASPTSYDLVIHGPAMATVIVKGVTVTVGNSTTPVNIGTITPRAATSFTVNLTTTTPLPAGALVGFYQTLPGTTEVPYLIEQQPIDPFSRNFDSDQAISAASLDYGTLSGSAVSLTTDATPTEGASTYRVAASAPLFANGVLTTTVTAPSVTSSTATLVPVLTLSPASGITTTTVVTVTQTSPTTYDQGELIVSHDGAIVATAALNAIMGRSAASTLTISGLPSGTGTSGTLTPALYYVSVRVWNSADPAKTLNRITYPNALDLRTASSTASSASYSIQFP